MSENYCYSVEVTDTFGGEANYSWVERYSLVAPKGLSDRALVRRAKAVAGWTGLRCRRWEYDETIELRPVGTCRVMFVSFLG